ncbi:MAG: PA3496 family putative envelope integrity protein [Gammaproteobacteria bacterium]
MQDYDFEEDDKIFEEEIMEDSDENNANDLEQAPPKANKPLNWRRKIEELMEEKRLRLELDDYEDYFSENRQKGYSDDTDDL